MPLILILCKPINIEYFFQLYLCLSSQRGTGDPGSDKMGPLLSKHRSLSITVLCIPLILLHVAAFFGVLLQFYL